METPLSTIVQTGDLGGQKVKMSFDENSLAHLMSVLTDLYSDKELAVIREYSTNALDAHIEAGNPDPINVITPSVMSPYFKVIDKGIGLSIDDITDMYSKYGASSKRETNSQVGMLGLGAKSALTLVNQFSLVSVKNGVKIWVSISRSADGSGQMEVIDTKATDEQNGVEISIPVPRSHSFADKCTKFFSFWKKGTVLLNGVEPTRIDGRWVSDDLVINKDLSQDYIVMGNVAYPAKEGLYGNQLYGYNSYRQVGVVAFVEIGAINFTPSREALMYTAQTNETIKSIRTNLEAKLTAAAEREVNKAETYGEAMKLANEWNTLFHRGLGKLRYKGLDIPKQVRIVPVDNYQQPIRENYYKEYSMKGVRSGYSTRWVEVDQNASNVLFVYGFADTLKMSPTQREKCRIYCEKSKLSMRAVAVSHMKAPLSSLWLDTFIFVDWADIAPIKVERNKSGNTVTRTDPYDQFLGAYRSAQITNIDDTKPIVYYSTAELQRPDFLLKMVDDGTIIMLSKNRWEKFKRDWPTAVHYFDFLKARQAAQLAQFTPADKILWSYSNMRYSTRHLSAALIDDPDLKMFISVLAKDNEMSAPAQALRSEFIQGGPRPVVEVPDNPMKKYLFLGSVGAVSSDHTYWYLNSYYKHLTDTPSA